MCDELSRPLRPLAYSLPLTLAYSLSPALEYSLSTPSSVFALLFALSRFSSLTSARLTSARLRQDRPARAQPHQHLPEPNPDARLASADAPPRGELVVQIAAARRPLPVPHRTRNKRLHYSMIRIDDDDGDIGKWW